MEKTQANRFKGPLSLKINKSKFQEQPLGIQIADILIDNIMDGTIKSGEQLLEANLQQQFGTSRTPIREALRELEKKRLITVIPRRGSFVKEITPEDIKENFPVRAALEALAAREAYKNMTAKDLQSMADELKKMKQAMQDSNTKKYWEAHLRFHDIFVYNSGNELLLDILRDLRLHLQWFSLSYRYYEDTFDDHYNLHYRIYEMFCDDTSYNPDIEKLVQDHIEDSLTRFLGYLAD